ncbi:MAG: NAD-dependent epimerase/dehydratase family protein, partial [Ignavibacteriales bacterium]
MQILLTGVTGYIGKRLLPVLIELGHEVVCCVRDKNRFPIDGVYKNPKVSLIEIDFLKDINSSGSSLSIIKNIDVAYYLIHSMSSNVKDFGSLEEKSANNFIKLVEPTSAKQIIYLGGIANEEKLSKHLASRKRV